MLRPLEAAHFALLIAHYVRVQINALFAILDLLLIKQHKHVKLIHLQNKSILKASQFVNLGNFLMRQRESANPAVQAVRSGNLINQFICMSTKVWIIATVVQLIN